MKMYLVRSYVNSCPSSVYGVGNSYYLVGLFTDEASANAAKEKAEAEAKLIDFNEYWDCHITTVDIIEIDANKVYQYDDQIYLGGGHYME